MLLRPLSIPLCHLNEARYIFPCVASLTDVTTDAVHGGRHTLSLLSVTLLMNISAVCPAYLTLILQVDVHVILLFHHASIWVWERLLRRHNTRVQLN